LSSALDPAGKITFYKFPKAEISRPRLWGRLEGEKGERIEREGKRVKWERGRKGKGRIFLKERGRGKGRKREEDRKGRRKEG